MNVRGYAAHASDSPLEPFQFERRVPGEKDVQIEIEHCGICHSDIHFVRDDWGMATYPCVPGHEIVGRVTAVGSGVTKYRDRDLVGVGCMVDSCRTCGSCMEGLENFCENGLLWTYGGILGGEDNTYGGYSSHIVVDQDFVVRVPESLDCPAAAPLLCAGITTYSPLRRVGLSRGDRIAVMGFGGLGHMAVQFADSMGAEVAVFSRSPAKEQDARKLGADIFVDTTEDEALAPFAGHFDFIVNTVSAEHDLMGPLNTLRRDGTMIMLGAGPDPLTLSSFPLLFGRRSIMGSLIGGIAETQEMLDYCGEHDISCQVEEIPPSGINEAYERALASDVRYRFVIDCTQM